MRESVHRLLDECPETRIDAATLAARCPGVTVNDIHRFSITHPRYKGYVDGCVSLKPIRLCVKCRKPAHGMICGECEKAMNDPSLPKNGERSFFPSCCDGGV